MGRLWNGNINWENNKKGDTHFLNINFDNYICKKKINLTKKDGKKKNTFSESVFTILWINMIIFHY